MGCHVRPIGASAWASPAAGPPGPSARETRGTDFGEQPHEESLAIATAIRPSLFDYSRADACCGGVSSVSANGLGAAQQRRALCRSRERHTWMHPDPARRNRERCHAWQNFQTETPVTNQTETPVTNKARGPKPAPLKIETAPAGAGWCRRAGAVGCRSLLVWRNKRPRSQCNERQFVPTWPRKWDLISEQVLHQNINLDRNWTSEGKFL